MKRKLSKIAMALTAVLFMSIFSPNVIGENMEYSFSNLYNKYYALHPDMEFVIKETIDSYTMDNMFLEHYENSPDQALEILDVALNNEITLEIANSSSSNLIQPFASTPVGSGGMSFYCYVDETIVQQKDTWCGVASTLMALTGIQKYNPKGLVSNFTKPSQTAISKSVIPAGKTTAYVYAITDYLNSKLVNNKYTYKKITSSVTKSDITNYIIYSLDKNRPVILHAKPYQAFNYYRNSEYKKYTDGHYLVVEEYNTYTKTFTVSDPTYLKKDGVQGRHYGITIDEIYKSLYKHSSERYIIVA